MAVFVEKWLYLEANTDNANILWRRVKLQIASEVKKLKIHKKVERFYKQCPSSITVPNEEESHDRVVLVRYMYSTENLARRKTWSTSGECNLQLEEK